MTMTDVCDYLDNWFIAEPIVGKHTISGGVLLAPPSGIQTDDYFFIKGSKYNDGVHQYNNTSDDLEDETFEGSVGVMSVPKAVVELLTDINAFIEKYGDVSPYSSESFGGYSYSKATVNGSPITWQTAFASRLRRWKKVR